jgi:hypothetical protein
MMLRDRRRSLLLNRVIEPGRIKFSLLACCVSLVGTAAVAQRSSEPAKSDQRSTQAESSPAADKVPAGGCMPIGLTARGDLVFPLQCRELIERERGPISEEQTRAVQQKLDSASQTLPKMPAIKQREAGALEQREAVRKKKPSRQARQKQTAPMLIAPQEADLETTGDAEHKSGPSDER